MYKCLECKNIFDDPKEIIEDTTPGTIYSEPGFEIKYKVCPYCHGDYEKIEEKEEDQ